MSRPLEHLRVLDLSRILAGPICGQTLADLGATVIKIERPGSGDDTRAWGPPFVEGTNGERVAAYFLSCNRGKKSVTIDFTQPQGRDLVLGLAGQCDILLENYKVGGLAKYGLDYASVKAVNPGIVYCSITGFGYSGPYRDRVGYDYLIQGMSGLMSITGEPDTSPVDLEQIDGQAGAPGGAPMKVGVAVSDIFTGLYAGIGILAAIAHRDRTGEGQHIDMALLDGQVGALANQALNFLATGEAPQRLGNAHPNIVPYQVFETGDGHMILAVGNDGQFQRFCELAGCPEFASGEKFATNQARVQHREELVAHLEPLLRARSTENWIVALQDANVPCGPINNIEQLFDDPQVIARGLQLAIAHPTFGTVPSVACPIRYSATPLTYEVPPPALGEHVDEVLGDMLDLSAADITSLRAAGIV